MTSLFADTFYWIAVTDVADASNHRAMALTNKLHGIPLVTTDEVLIEFLTFFAGSGPALRFKAAGVVQLCTIRAWSSRHPPIPRLVPCGPWPLRAASRQGLQPNRLHLHANHASRRHHGSSHQRPPLRAGRLSSPLSNRLAHPPAFTLLFCLC